MSYLKDFLHLRSQILKVGLHDELPMYELHAPLTLLKGQLCLPLAVHHVHTQCARQVHLLAARPLKSKALLDFAQVVGHEVSCSRVNSAWWPWSSGVGPFCAPVTFCRQLARLLPSAPSEDALV